MLERLFVTTPKDRLFVDVDAGRVISGDRFARQYCGRPLSDLLSALRTRDGGDVVVERLSAPSTQANPAPVLCVIEIPQTQSLLF